MTDTPKRIWVANRLPPREWIGGRPRMASGNWQEKYFLSSKEYVRADLVAKLKNEENPGPI